MKYFNRISSQEISEDSLSKIIEYYRLGQVEKAKDVISAFSMEEFVFGLSRSDFLYYLPINKESKVLDIGCGLGTHTFNMASFALDVYGVDISEKKIAFCEGRKKNEGVNNVHFLQSKTEDLLFSENTFDSILIHKNIEKNLQYAYTLLKPNGVLYFGVESKLTSIFLKKKYKRMLKKVGFDDEPDFYIAYPNYHIPRFLIPLQDTVALKFILNSMTAYKGFSGALIRFFIKIPFFAPVFNGFSHNYAIFVKK